tara:strand:+ start:221 stop:484 length:264 start_codon:yes stop_codon:yes gene_type:complete
MPLKKISLRLDENDLEHIDKLASEQNTTRANIIRHSLQQKSITPDALHQVTTAIRKRFHGIFTVQQAEQAAAIAIFTIAQNQERKAA